jgi:uncharacterized protein
MFVGRKLELAQLAQLYQSGSAELFVLYGRRRVGKTELLRAFADGKSPVVFFIATLGADREQLMAFSQEIWRAEHGDVSEGFTFPTWEAAFRALVDLPGRPVVVIDEFTYLISGHKALSSILQKVWDARLSHSKVMLILCGSYMGMMEREVLEQRAPLYGRRTGINLLQPLGLSATAEFFPTWTPAQKLELWATLGGMPYYLNTFKASANLWGNIRQHILDPQGNLYHEPQLLLQEELREPRNYFSILRAIAQGHTRQAEIVQSSGVGDATMVARYLDILQQMRVVKRDVPVTESQPEKSKKGLYQITDHFLRFWFAHVHPNQAALDMGLADNVLKERIRPNFESFVAPIFEEAARNYVLSLARQGRLPFVPDRIGRWWDKAGEIDVVALNKTDDAWLLGECKWSIRQIGTNVLDNLKRAAQILLTGRKATQVTYALFARSGFTTALQDVAQREEVLLVKVDEMITEGSPGSG